jgi:hypothetical protein
MVEVGKWIAANTIFDRLYFYAADRPLHVSFGPENKREVIELTKTSSGRLVPKVRRK